MQVPSPIMFGPRLLHTSDIVFKKCFPLFVVFAPQLRSPGDGPVHNFIKIIIEVRCHLLLGGHRGKRKQEYSKL